MFQIALTAVNTVLIGSIVWSMHSGKDPISIIRSKFSRSRQ